MPDCRYCGQQTGFITYCPSHYFHEQLCFAALSNQRKKVVFNPPEHKKPEEKISQLEKKIPYLEVSFEVLETSVKKITKLFGQVQSVMEVSLVKELVYFPGHMGTFTINYLESLSPLSLGNCQNARDLFDKVQIYHGDNLDTYSSIREKKVQSCVFLQDVIRVMFRKTINQDVKDILVDMLFEIQLSRNS
jgi:hypothetical protein